MVILILALAWILICSCMFFLVLKTPLDHFAKLRISSILGIALMLRFVPAILLQQGASYEMNLFQEIAAQALAGENVLTQLPYLPFFVYWMAIAEWLSRTTGVHFTFWLKLPSILADVMIIAVLYWRMVKSGDSYARINKSLWLYVFNPVTILVVSYHGQFDVLALLFLILSIVVLELYDSKRYSFLAGLILGVGILIKTWPGIFILTVIASRNLKEKLGFVLAAAIVPFVSMCASILVFGGELGLLFRIPRRALQAGAIPGWWGYTGLANGVSWLLGHSEINFDGLMRFKLLIVFLPVMLMVFFSRRKPVSIALLNALFALFIFAPGFGLQSLSWLIPFFICCARRNSLGWYVGLSFLHMLVSYWGVHFTPALYTVFSWDIIRGIVQLSAVPVWLLLIVLVLKREMENGVSEAKRCSL